jgi:hypothetical protein
MFFDNGKRKGNCQWMRTALSFVGIDAFVYIPDGFKLTGDLMSTKNDPVSVKSSVVINLYVVQGL